jgi:hypothetical protein
MISIICAFNDEQVLEACLLSSLKDQATNCEIIVINNTESRFKSAAEALNWGGAQAVGDYLMFVHQDVDLPSDSWLDGTEALLDSLPDLGVAGVAGLSERGGPFAERYSNTIHHRPQARYRNVITQGPHMDRWGTPIQEPERVQTVDECLVIIPKSVFKMVQFDEVTCDDWHLYATDYCLSIAARGFSVYAIPKCIHHQSEGYEERGALGVIRFLGLHPEGYYRTLEHVLNKHKNQYTWIHTSCGSWNTAYPLGLQRAKLVLKHLVLSIIFRS